MISKDARIPTHRLCTQGVSSHPRHLAGLSAVDWSGFGDNWACQRLLPLQNFAPPPAEYMVFDVVVCTRCPTTKLEKQQLAERATIHLFCPRHPTSRDDPIAKHQIHPNRLVLQHAKAADPASLER
eukprot:scaffold10797_cov187-Amphora_coffeaeformis.AAC.2